MDVGSWLRGLGLERYAQAFLDAEVTPEVLPELTGADLRELGLPLGPRKAVLKAIRKLAASPTSAALVGVASNEAGSARPPIAAGAERRQLTVMFVDLVGSTALSVRLDPEEMGAVLRAYQVAVAGEVARFEGHVAKFMGDGVLAYFGWPKAHENEAERAVRAGLAVVDAVRGLSTLAAGPLSARVGIATGLVVVGDLFGEGAAREETVVGETPNLAARLQQVALPDTVVVADGTRRLLGQVFKLRPLGLTQLKGFDRPVSGFQALGEGSAGSRFEAQRSGRLTPMVGRDQELELVLERWRRAAAGEGQAVLLVGEAGIGKSRLVRAALDAATDDAHVALHYQCSPYHAGTTLWPIAQELGAAAGFDPADTDAVKLDKLETLLRQSVETIDETAPLMAALLGIDPGARYPVPDLTPQQRRARTLAALVERLLGLAYNSLVLMVLEDAHWSDPTTLELLGQTLDRIADGRVLMLLTSRPGDQLSLGGHAHVTQLTLSRLGRGPTEAIVTRLAGDQGLPPAVVHEIAARADGVPLFVEELTKAVLEADGMGLAVPASLHASLMARLDRVPGVKEVAQVAACIGREFTYPLLAAVSPLPEPALRAALNRLASAELVFARGEPPDASYVFKHALVRDAAHESLLKSRRQELHAHITRTIEERFLGTVAAEPELLAGHLAEAGQAARAARQWLRAAELAIVRSSNLEAIVHCEQAEGQLQTILPSPERARAELEVQLAKGIAARTGKGQTTAEAEQAFSRACELCEELSDRVGLVHALRGLFTVYAVRSQWRDATQVASRLGAAAAGFDDPVALALRGFVEGTTRLFTGRPVEALQWFREGLRHCRDGDRDAHIRLSGHYTATLMLAYSSYALIQLGKFGEARRCIRASLAAARKQKNPATLAFALWSTSRFAELGRTNLEPEDGASELCNVAAEHRLPYWAATGRVARGRDLLRLGAHAEAKAEIEAGLAAQQASGARLHLAENLALLAEARAAADDLEGALASLDDALEHTVRSGECWYDAELNRARAAVLRRLGRDEDATTCLGKAVEAGRKQGALLWELRSARDLARIWRDQGRPGEALELLAPIYGAFVEGLDTLDLVEARALLEDLA